MNLFQYTRRAMAFAIFGLVVTACGGSTGNAASDSAPAHAIKVESPVQPLEVSPDYWKDLVTGEAWDVLFREGTERPFTSPLNKEYSDGTFICAACYLPLMSSGTKFDSGTGWPSFYAPIEGHVGFMEDNKLPVPRTEYHCIRCGGHQGHVFNDGPKPTGQRWCNNGVALKFVPAGQELPALRGGMSATSAPASRPASGDGETARAVFAGGCFWCIEKDFEKVDGVISVVSGYTGGHTENPTYDAVNTHRTGHVEAVEITFDTARISYERLLDIFWVSVDPTDGGGQFCDRGNTYASGIFYLDDAQKEAAEASVERARKWLKVEKPIVTEIRAAATFYDAEEYHQDFYKKNPERYNSYRTGCRRDARLKKIWGDAVEHH